MVVRHTHISWTHTTVNPWIGCVQVSAGCENCYAKELVDVRYKAAFGHPFEQVKLKMERLREIGKLRPIEGKPHLVFVNSMSDFFIDQVEDEHRHAVLDAFERQPGTVAQILTKRPVQARKFLVNRYGNRGIPDNIWIGVSAEDNRVAKRIDILRSIKDRVGDMVAFLSVEPIVGPTHKLDFTGIDWVISGGESGPRARIMQRDWLMPVVERSQAQGVPLWHKQSGQIRSHPNFADAPAVLGVNARFEWLKENGFEVLPQEKGGATVDKVTYRALPAAHNRISDKLVTAGTLL